MNTDIYCLYSNLYDNPKSRYPYVTNEETGAQASYGPAQVYEYHAQVIALQPMVLFPLHKGIKETSSGLLCKMYVTKGLFERIHSGTKRK